MPRSQLAATAPPVRRRGLQDGSLADLGLVWRAEQFDGRHHVDRHQALLYRNADPDLAAVEAGAALTASWHRRDRSKSVALTA
jgi:hypothetical protein